MKNPSQYAREFMREHVLKSIPIIDVHAHMGPVYGTSLPFNQIEDMIRIMELQNIERIICSTHAALFDPGTKNTEIELAMARYPGKISGYFAFNPNYAEDLLPDINNVMRIKGYLGFKFLPEYHRYPLNGSGYRDALDFANKHQLLLLIHTWGGSAYNSPKHVREILERYPQITIILGHSAPGDCDNAIKLARDYPQAYLDLCDIHRHSGIIERMVEGAGAEKVIFGTDIPWYDPNYCLGSILFAHISDDDRYKIICGNARRIIKQVEDGKS